MRIALQAALTTAALITCAAAASGQLPAITGDYGLSGTDGRAKYTGTANIMKIGGEMYRAKWTIGARVFSGVCFRESQSLSCASCPANLNPTVVSYLASAKGLDGVFFSNGGTQIGKEILTPKGYREGTKEVQASKGQMNPVTLVGQFDVKGTNPDKSPYSGSASTRQLYAVSPSAYEFDWTIGARTLMHGVGVRDVTGSPIVAAQCGGASGSVVNAASTVALVYSIDIKGRVLTGAWTQLISGATTAGTETMTKWK
jgi:hypothetical protein